MGAREMFGLSLSSRICEHSARNLLNWLNVHCECSGEANMVNIVTAEATAAPPISTNLIMINLAERVFSAPRYC